MLLINLIINNQLTLINRFGVKQNLLKHQDQELVVGNHQLDKLIIYLKEMMKCNHKTDKISNFFLKFHK